MVRTVTSVLTVRRQTVNALITPTALLRTSAGITNPAGNVLGLMPHPEDHIVPVQGMDAPTGRLGLRLFQSYDFEHRIDDTTMLTDAEIRHIAAMRLDAIDLPFLDRRRQRQGARDLPRRRLSDPGRHRPAVGF